MCADPGEPKMNITLPENEVTVYVTSYCPYCVSAKRMLDRLGVPYRSHDCSHEPDTRSWLVGTTGLQTVPQIFIGTKSIGGFSDMDALHKKGGLIPLLNERGIPHKV